MKTLALCEGKAEPTQYFCVSHLSVNRPQHSKKGKKRNIPLLFTVIQRPAANGALELQNSNPQKSKQEIDKSLIHSLTICGNKRCILLEEGEKERDSRWK